MRRYANNERANLADVSIHASVKDATKTFMTTKKATNVSIHASVKDATFNFSKDNWLLSFNPRICKRCDAALRKNSYAPVSFNPRICKRCD